MITIRGFLPTDVRQMMEIWNDIVELGEAFPQEEALTFDGAMSFFGGQSHTAVAVDEGAVVGLYILHPNNIGRCGHIANASYAVASARRGEHIGEALVKDCIGQCERLGFRVLQFNAVVSTNTPALKLYSKLGFTQLGTIPQGFRRKDGSYADIIPHYISIIKNNQVTKNPERL